MLNKNLSWTLDLYLLKKVKKKDEVLTVDDFIDVGATYLDKKELSAQIKRHMIEGQPIDVNKIKLIPEFTIEINNDIPKVNLTKNAALLKIYQW